MFKILGEYKGRISQGIIIGGDLFLPNRKKTIKLDGEQLERMTEAEKNGWFVIHTCDPENPFKVVEEVVETPVVEEIKEEVTETPVVEEVAEEVVEEVKEEVVEEVKEEVVEEVKEEKKTKSRKKSTAKEEK